MATWGWRCKSANAGLLAYRGWRCKSANTYSPAGAGGARPRIPVSRLQGPAVEVRKYLLARGGRRCKAANSRDSPSGAGGGSPQIPEKILPSRRSGNVILEDVGVTSHGDWEGSRTWCRMCSGACCLAPGVGCVSGLLSLCSASGALALSGKPVSGSLDPQWFDVRIRKTRRAERLVGSKPASGGADRLPPPVSMPKVLPWVVRL